MSAGMGAGLRASAAAGCVLLAMVAPLSASPMELEFVDSFPTLDSDINASIGVLPTGLVSATDINSTSVGTADAGEIGFFFLQGHSVAQSYLDTGLPAVDRVELDLVISRSFLVNDNQINWRVWLETTAVGFWSWALETPGMLELELTGFAPVVDSEGDGYRLRMEVLNDVPADGGSIALAAGLDESLRLSVAASVPEPGAPWLLGLGLCGLWYLRRASPG